MSKNKIEYYSTNLPEITRNCSKKERNAETAEQAVDDLKK